LRNPRQLPTLALARGSAPALPLPPVIPQQYLHPGLSMMQLFAILRARRRIIFLTMFTIMLGTAVVLKVIPKTYTAIATLMVNYEVNEGSREQPTPIGAVNSYMATQIELIQSPEVLMPVVDRLRLTRDPEFTAGFLGSDPDALRDWVEKALLDDLTVEQGKGSQLIYLNASAHDPVKAALLANTIADVYVEQERALVNNPASQRAHEYSTELAELQAKATDAQQKLTAFQQSTGITDFNAQGDMEAQSLNYLEQQLLAAQNARRAAEARAAVDQASSTTMLNAGTVTQLKNQLAIQESELAQLSTTLGPQHPRIVELRSQITSTRAALSREVQSYTNNSNTELTSAKQLEEKLQRAVDTQRTKLLAVRKQQDEASKLVLELQSAQTVYKRGLEGFDQVKFASSGHLTNLSFVSRATPPVEAAKPKKAKFMILGALAGMFLGIVCPLCFELLFNRRLRCRDDIERDFGIPVLAEFDPIPAGYA
jgi:uncharacterized protein involved in exopolysaccharide biosynthesis